MVVKVWATPMGKHRHHGSVWVYLWVKHRYHGSKGVGLSMGKTSISW